MTSEIFPFRGFTPAYAVGGVSLLVLAVAVYGFFARKRRLYVLTALAALYLNVFVLVAQIFQKTPALKELAPTQTEPAFAMGQGVVFLLIVALGFAAVRGTRSPFAGPSMSR